ncbi:hypothetical protein KI809_09400 [Geobacter pelophilus]|uniref:Uncharacterized protein n=1 Tax=Geoanaerobacter pelophilus TaxID=60036 RepID=A0AAW4L1C7_9BACT|nr:hypothetical protein [Geoanaerobacter pelophilus]MBT0664514.1 hypothetical protein [Geoanaerobacter pelophilus]
MCGYCAEEIALDILSNEVRGNLQMKNLSTNLHRYYFLRESPDFVSALDRLRRSLALKRVPFYSEIPHKIVLCRGLEVLLKGGFDSAPYQRLLKMSLYRDAISTLCSGEMREAFESATQGLTCGHLGMLYDAETYFWEGRVKKLQTLSTAIPSCLDLLRHYISWWLDGNGLQMVDEYSVTNEEYFRFALLFRAIFFSTLLVGRISAGRKIMSAIACKCPAGTPVIDGDDVWLQRIATHKLYSIEGFDAFIEHLSKFRYGHFFYIDQVCGFSVEQKQALLTEVRSLLDAERSYDLILMSEWLGNDVGENLF